MFENNLVCQAVIIDYIGVPEVGDLIRNKLNTCNFINLVVKVEHLRDSKEVIIHSIRFLKFSHINRESYYENRDIYTYDKHLLEFNFLDGKRIRPFKRSILKQPWWRRTTWNIVKINRIETTEMSFNVQDKINEVLNNLEDYYYHAPQIGNENASDN